MVFQNGPSPSEDRNHWVDDERRFCANWMIVVGRATVGIYLLLHDYCADCIRPPTLSKTFVESDT